MSRYIHFTKLKHLIFPNGGSTNHSTTQPPERSRIHQGKASETKETKEWTTHSSLTIPVEDHRVEKKCHPWLGDGRAPVPPMSALILGLTTPRATRWAPNKSACSSSDWSLLPRRPCRIFVGQSHREEKRTTTGTKTVSGVQTTYDKNQGGEQ
jgi:hypothetical protein